LASISIVVVVDVLVPGSNRNPPQVPVTLLQLEVVVFVALGVAPPEHVPTPPVLKFGHAGSVHVAPEQLHAAPLPPVFVEDRRQAPVLPVVPVAVQVVDDVQGRHSAPTQVPLGGGPWRGLVLHPAGV
jgi:hypothetical protein